MAKITKKELDRQARVAHRNWLKMKAYVKADKQNPIRYDLVTYDRPIQMVAGETCGAFMADGSPMV